MRILYIAEDIEVPGFHGGSTHVQETVKSLEKLGHSVLAVCKNSGMQKEKESMGKAEFLRLKVPSSPFLKYCFYFFRLDGIISKIIEKQKFDIVWQRNRIFGGSGVILGKKKGARTIFELNEPVEAFSGNPLYFLIRGKFLKTVEFADRVTGTHASMFEGVPKEKRLLINYGSNAELFNPSRKDRKISEKFGLAGKTLFYSGSFQEWHCLKNAILAFEEIVKKEPKAAFLLAGEGRQRKGLEELVVASERKIQRIFFLGKVPYEKLAFYINASNACLALFDRTSRQVRELGYYYSPIKVHDYKACGKPVIASNIGNLKELVKENENGFLVNEQNKAEISLAFLKALKSKKLAIRIREKNIKEAREKYNWAKVTEGILEAVK